MAVSEICQSRARADCTQVSEYPGKTDHYRMCLGIIANASGEERHGIKTYLDTGTKGQQIKKREKPANA